MRTVFTMLLVVAGVIAFGLLRYPIETILVIGALGYGAFHHHHYRKHRDRGLNIWASVRGPFGTRIGKRL